VSRRYFVASARVGAANEASGVEDGRPIVARTVTVSQEIDGRREEFPAVGPKLALLGPGDVLGFDRSLVVREEPPAGSLNAVAENLACVEFSDASLPWQFSPPFGNGPSLPWMVLVVLRDKEGVLTGGDPLPVLAAPASALPDLANSWAWAHIEVRADDSVQNPKQDVETDVRSGSQAVISRLICPRKLEPERDWLACVVPATSVGVATGLGKKLAGGPFDPPWRPGQADPVRLPVYHSWRFRTDKAGSFEELARLVGPVKAAELPDFGTRTIDVGDPWPGEKDGPAASVKTSIQGALRVPETEATDETWSDDKARKRFVKLLGERLDMPASRFTTTRAEPHRDDRDEEGVAPPLYGSHFSGAQTVPEGGWQAALNLQVRHRLAASLGARYVQLEQEFLIARAWEQVGAIREANRLLAVSELSSEASTLAQAKHLREMEATEVALFADPIRAEVKVESDLTLAHALESSALPGGAASSPFRRLTRPGGGLDRRVGRVRSALGARVEGRSLVIDPELGKAGVSVLSAGLDGEQILPESVTAVTAEAPDVSPPVGFDAPSLLAATALESAASPGVLRGLRRHANGELLVRPVAIAPSVRLGVADVAASVRGQVEPLGQQLQRVTAMISADDMAQRAESDPRPLRRIMEHPRFGMPIAAELLARWPEWAVPGISSFPPNSATLLETNSPFVEAAMVGLNQEFNRELLWREFPTDQRGTAFARFWPSEVDNPDVDEIARWAPDAALGEHDETGGQDPLVLLVRGEVLRRFPGTVVLAAKSTPDGLLPKEGSNDWRTPTFLLAVDEQTTLFGFDLTEAKAHEGKWLFVLREPMRGTQFGSEHLTGPNPGALGTDAAEVARILFLRPFQLAISAGELLGTPPP
jgi:hypothetical protein